VTYNSTRKQFFAKLLGMVGTVSVLPKLFAKSESSDTTSAASKPAASAFKIRRDNRTVARRDVA